MIYIREAILVEGRYDKNVLEQIVTTEIFETGGFQIMTDPKKIAFLRNIAEKQGLIVLTDSDGAGLVIRNRLKSCIPKDKLLHAYIPDIAGKERRKRHPGKAGLLGVEGMSPEVLLEALTNCGAHILGASEATSHITITRSDLYRLGITGGYNSATLRNRIKKHYKLPENLGTNGLVDALNILTTLEELENLVKE